MTEINFNMIDKSFEIVSADTLIQGSDDINLLKVWFGTYVGGVFIPNTTLVQENSKVIGAIFTRSDDMHTWFINFAPQLDGSFLTTLKGWVLRKYGMLRIDVQIRTITTGATDPFNRVSLLVNEGTSLEDDTFIFTEADYQNMWETINMVVVNADADLMVGTVRAYTQELPLSGLRLIDGVTLVENDRVLVTGQGDLNGIYIAQTGEWIKETDVYKNQVVSVDAGYIYGGVMVKKLPNGTSKIVKNPERMKWRVV